MSILPRRARAAFTLIELLVVIAIIATLAALAVSATMRIITVQDEANSRVLVRKVYATFEKQWQAVSDKAFKEPIPDSASSTIMNMAGGDAQRARVIYVKLRLKQEFPMGKAEVMTPTILPAVTTYVQALTPAIFPAGGAEENSACLLLALQQARGGIIVNADDLGSNALIEATTNGAGVKMIVDSWGKPVVFFRWPTGNMDVDALNPGQTVQQQTFRDTQDPMGLLQTPTWWPPNRGAFESALHLISQGGSRPHSYYMVPVVASGGPDKQLGLSFPDMTPDGAASNDNIYSYDRK